MKTITKTTIGKDRDGRLRYHAGQCSGCGMQFVSDLDRLILVGHLRFCGDCEADAMTAAER